MIVDRTDFFDQTQITSVHRRLSDITDMFIVFVHFL